jgi:5-methylcytosine-specific restriction endonuclease McrA
MSMPWFRLYGRIIDNDKIKLLAFEDRWHFIAFCCLKNDGVLDEPDSELRTRRIAVKLGVQVRELEEISRRLRAVDLIDEAMQPLSWDRLQFKTDNSTSRVKKYREKRKENGLSSGSSGYQKHYPALMKRDNGACVYCHQTDNLCIDHMMPIVQGGTDDLDNLAIACKACNSGKAGRTPRQAGYKILSKQAVDALSRYVTVTVTAPDTDTDTDKKEVVSKAPCEPSGSLTPADLLESWNEFASAHGLPKALKLTKTRLAHAKARLREYPRPEDWELAYSKLGQSKFCKGENNRGWKASFDFILSERSLTNIMEGQYG